MKKSAILTIAVISMLAVAFNSCKKEEDKKDGDQENQTNQGLSGTLRGFVQLYDQYGYRVYHPQDSSALQIGSTVVRTDSTGLYTFSLTTGTYDVTITSRPGGNYGTDMIQGLQFTGGGIVNRDVALSQIPNFTITSITATDTAFPNSNPVQYVKFKGTVSSTDTRPRTVAVFANTSSTVSSIPSQYLFAYDPTNPVIAANSSTFTFYVKSANIYLGTGLAPTQTAYFAVYPAAVAWNSTSNYLDYFSDRKIYTAIASTPVLANVVMQ